MTDSPDQQQSTPVPLSANARRVLGVLVEKAKTTPDAYPLSLAAIVTGSNQKSNRSPKMELDEDAALLALDELRERGAVREVHGSGRVIKYRHAIYDWLDLDNETSAVMTELLLRGPQTMGEIRIRASRMCPLEDLDAAKKVVDVLIDKGLVESLTPPGRGQLFTHTLYPPEERQYLGLRVEKQAAAAPAAEPAMNRDAVEQLVSRIESVNERIDALEKRIAELES